jgi:hypothetical protein
VHRDHSRRERALLFGRMKLMIDSEKLHRGGAKGCTQLIESKAQDKKHVHGSSDKN